MRVTRPLLGDVPEREEKTFEVVADHARIVSESFVRWSRESDEKVVDTSGIWEGIVWMR
jgi:hypothetical protein